VVFFELWAIAYVRARYMSTPFVQAVFQIVLGGSIVLAVDLDWRPLRLEKVTSGKNSASERTC
jgi:hypothetical protein